MRKTRKDLIAELEAQKAALELQIKNLKRNPLFQIRFNNGNVFRELDLSKYNSDEIALLKAYKYLFENMNKSQEEIGRAVRQYFQHGEKVSTVTINKKWNVVSLVNKYSFTQFTRAVSWSMHLEHKAMMNVFSNLK